MQWEYVTHAVEIGGWLMQTGGVNPPALTGTLNWFGQQGWELVSAFDTNIANGGTRNVVLIFKRPVARTAATAAPPPPMPPEA